MNTQEITTTNDIRFKEQLTDRIGNPLIINIRLNDECKNGHNDFSITGDLYTKGKPFIDRYCQGGGAMGDEIAKWHPKYKIFNDLHLCDAKGAPMYAQAKGFYHLKNSSKETVIKYLRITDDEYNTLATAEDEKYFTYLLDNVLAIPVRWEKEALQAIALLEEMTGKKFQDDSVRYQYTPLSAEAAKDVADKIASGYYTPEAIELRAKEKAAAQHTAKINKLIEDKNKSFKKINDDFDVKMYVLLYGLPIDNLIYYNHTNEAVFNWNDSSYASKITQQQFDIFSVQIDFTKLPIDIKFKLGK